MDFIIQLICIGFLICSGLVCFILDTSSRKDNTKFWSILEYIGIITGTFGIMAAIIGIILWG